MLDAAKAAAHPAIAEFAIRDLQESNAVLLDALKVIHARLMDCARAQISASDAYDSFYQEVVQEAIAKALAQQPQALQHCADAI